MKKQAIVVACAIVMLCSPESARADSNPTAAPSDQPSAVTGTTDTGSDVLTFMPTATGTSSLAAESLPIITCTPTYDYPHVSTTSSQTTINAHLTIKCTVPPPYSTNMQIISVKSRMLTGARTGAYSYNDGNNTMTVKTGGDLACVTAIQTYRAEGGYTALAPEGYTPSFGSGDAYSISRQFKKNSAGKCVAV